LLISELIVHLKQRTVLDSANGCHMFRAILIMVDRSKNMTVMSVML